MEEALRFVAHHPLPWITTQALIFSSLSREQLRHALVTVAVGVAAANCQWQKESTKWRHQETETKPQEGKSRRVTASP